MDAVARLLAIEEIKQLKARYFRLMDERDWAGLAEVFCREAIVAWISGAFAQQTSVHHGHCHEITIDSATEAHGVIAMQDMIFGPDRKTRVLSGAGHYHERYRREDGAWRIAETRLTRLFVDLADDP